MDQRETALKIYERGVKYVPNDDKHYEVREHANAFTDAKSDVDFFSTAAAQSLQNALESFVSCDCSRRLLHFTSRDH